MQQKIKLFLKKSLLLILQLFLEASLSSTVVAIKAIQIRYKKGQNHFNSVWIHLYTIQGVHKKKDLSAFYNRLVKDPFLLTPYTFISLIKLTKKSKSGKVFDL